MEIVRTELHNCTLLPGSMVWVTGLPPMVLENRLRPVMDTFSCLLSIHSQSTAKSSDDGLKMTSDDVSRPCTGKFDVQLRGTVDL